jgi:hypothetical protein
VRRVNDLRATAIGAGFFAAISLLIELPLSSAFSMIHLAALGGLPHGNATANALALCIAIIAFAIPFIVLAQTAIALFASIGVLRARG